ncbi:DUF2336 domain-containing protein [Emcibacter sp.]|uniref:DUF2336 domain-containing protein n=1 Tax=Emcibacter sp. TaxID=1979954 RepID=UPI002AA6CD23|nr:DUF2336 domain-containing protein [Emcibacter sp.]
MKNLLNKIFDKNDKKNLSYEKARAALEKQKANDKKLLAQRPETQPEVLYYLASDQDAAIRRDVAGNESTPIQADEILANDNDNEVREELARKISRIFPDLSRHDQVQIREKAIEILEKLASDQFPKVRQIVSEELKSSDLVPHRIIKTLAMDEELAVCAPILEYSPLLSDVDLKEIIAVTTVSGALSAIAQRDSVSEDISDALTNSLDIPAVSALIANQNAQIREDTLDAIIDQARSIETMHPPLAERPNLSLRAIKRIAGFVASSLVTRMIEKNHLEKNIADEILTSVRQRIQDQQVDEEDVQTLAEQARDLVDKGVVDDDFIQNALANKQRELVIQCLGLLSQIHVDNVRKLIASNKSRRIVALAWRSELSMRTALNMQHKLAHIPPEDFLNAKDGVDYPLSTAEMEYELELYA